MTLIVLAVLAAAWLLYLALWLRDRRAAQPSSGDAIIGFGPSFNDLGPGALLAGNSGEGVKPLGDLLESPRTRQQALRRRRHVAAMLVSLAILSLLVSPVLGSSALAVHVLADVGLILFAFGSVRREPVPVVSLADVRVLYPDRPVPSHAGAMPLRRVASG